AHAAHLRNAARSGAAGLIRKPRRGDDVMFRKVAFTMYPVKDVARARRFYGEILGLREGLAGNQGEHWWIEYDLPEGGCIALTNFVAGDSGAAALALEVADLDE